MNSFHTHFAILIKCEPLRSSKYSAFHLKLLLSRTEDVGGSGEAGVRNMSIRTHMDAGSVFVVSF
jgi:hypothetical protein